MKPAMLCKLLSQLCLVITGTVYAQQTCDLRWRVVPGQTLEYETVAKGLAPMDLQSGPQADAVSIHVDLAIDMAMITRQLCKSVDSDGSGHFEQGFPLFNIKMGAKAGNQAE